MSRRHPASPDELIKRGFRCGTCHAQPAACCVDARGRPKRESHPDRYLQAVAAEKLPLGAARPSIPLATVVPRPRKPQVMPGSLWADDRPRQRGRTVRVVSVDSWYADCVVVTPRDGATRAGHKTRIQLSAFHHEPLRTGYSRLEPGEAASR